MIISSTLSCTVNISHTQYVQNFWVKLIWIVLELGLITYLFDHFYIIHHFTSGWRLFELYNPLTQMMFALRLFPPNVVIMLYIRCFNNISVFLNISVVYRPYKPRSGAKILHYGEYFLVVTVQVNVLLEIELSKGWFVNVSCQFGLFKLKIYLASDCLKGNTSNFCKN